MDFRGKIAATVIIVILGVTSTLSQDYIQICKERGCNKGKYDACIVEKPDNATNLGLGPLCAKVCPLFLPACVPSCPDGQTCVHFGGRCHNRKAKCVPNEAIVHY